MLHFFDCDLGVVGSGQGLPALQTPQAALTWMDRYTIERALVYDRAVMEAGVFDRFDALLDFCRLAGDRLSPTIPVAPPATGESPPPDELVGIILAHGIKAVRCWPVEHACIFDPFNFGALLERLQPHRIPVIVHLSEVHAWTRRDGYDELRETAQAFPDLPIVLLSSGMLDGRKLLPLLDGCPNIIADLTCVTYQFIEYVTERWGSGRLVFASHHPRIDPGLYLPWINYSGIDQQAREALAWRTAARLVEGIR